MKNSMFREKRVVFFGKGMLGKAADFANGALDSAKSALAEAQTPEGLKKMAEATKKEFDKRAEAIRAKAEADCKDLGQDISNTLLGNIESKKSEYDHLIKDINGYESEGDDDKKKLGELYKRFADLNVEKAIESLKADSRIDYDSGEYDKAMKEEDVKKLKPLLDEREKKMGRERRTEGLIAEGSSDGQPFGANVDTESGRFTHAKYQAILKTVMDFYEAGDLEPNQDAERIIEQHGDLIKKYIEGGKAVYEAGDKALFKSKIFNLGLAALRASNSMKKATGDDLSLEKKHTLRINTNAGRGGGVKQEERYSEVDPTVVCVEQVERENPRDDGGGVEGRDQPIQKTPEDLGELKLSCEMCKNQITTLHAEITEMIEKKPLVLKKFTEEEAKVFQNLNAISKAARKSYEDVSKLVIDEEMNRSMSPEELQAEFDKYIPLKQAADNYFQVLKDYKGFLLEIKDKWKNELNLDHALLDAQNAANAAEEAAVKAEEAYTAQEAAEAAARAQKAADDANIAVQRAVDAYVAEDADLDARVTEPQDLGPVRAPDNSGNAANKVVDAAKAAEDAASAAIDADEAAKAKMDAEIDKLKGLEDRAFNVSSDAFYSWNSAKKSDNLDDKIAALTELEFALDTATTLLEKTGGKKSSDYIGEYDNNISIEDIIGHLNDLIEEAREIVDRGIKESAGGEIDGGGMHLTHPAPPPEPAPFADKIDLSVSDAVPPRENDAGRE